ncbi:Glycophorin-C [Galemys pyrenaicus]|uniref:Glycophorin-C n=1 Tax=Galemys pyrenaicus TaxID=202257 RepID=A0A8J6A0R7_GALPY|nr:Glycophorin-C [Galemys pyrenaicus]
MALSAMSGPNGTSPPRHRNIVPKNRMPPSTWVLENQDKTLRPSKGLSSSPVALGSRPPLSSASCLSPSAPFCAHQSGCGVDNCTRDSEHGEEASCSIRPTAAHSVPAFQLLSLAQVESIGFDCHRPSSRQGSTIQGFSPTGSLSEKMQIKAQVQPHMTEPQDCITATVRGAPFPITDCLSPPWRLSLLHCSFPCTLEEPDPGMASTETDIAIIAGVITAVAFVLVCLLIVMMHYMYRHKGTYHTNEAKGTEFAESADAALQDDPYLQEAGDSSRKEYFI